MINQQKTVSKTVAFRNLFNYDVVDWLLLRTTLLGCVVMAVFAPLAQLRADIGRLWEGEHSKFL